MKAESFHHAEGMDDFTDAQAVAIERINRKELRLLERLFPRAGRVMIIDQLETVTDDVAEAAARILSSGAKATLRCKFTAFYR